MATKKPPPKRVLYVEMDEADLLRLAAKAEDEGHSGASAYASNVLTQIARQRK